ncbi:hypothetical protein KI387_010862, partial [Taxus chinensis]
MFHSFRKTLQKPPQVQEVANINLPLAVLREKTVDELERLLTDEKAYKEFLHSIEQVRQQDALPEEIQNVNAQIDCRIREKETQFLDLTKQCSDRKSIDLPAAQEKFDELKKQAEECNGYHASGVENAYGTELENLNEQLLAGELELSDFIEKHKKLGIIRYRRT